MNNMHKTPIRQAEDDDFDSRPAPVKILVRDGKKLAKPEVLVPQRVDYAALSASPWRYLKAL